MKILLICEAVFPENKGGLERWMTWFASELANRGNEVTYLNAAGVHEVRNRVSYIPVTGEKWEYLANGQRSIKQALKFAFKIRSKVKEVNPEVIYSAQAPIFSVFTLHFFRPVKYLLIVEWFEIWSKQYWKDYLGSIRGLIGFGMQKFATKLADLRVAFTSRCQIQLGGLNSKNLLLPGIHMIPKNLGSLQYSERRDIIFLGRFVPDKQAFLALASVVELKRLGWEGELHVIGSGPLVDQIRSRIQFLGAEDFVNVLENATEERLQECFLKSFILLHPSKREGYGLAMIEAAERQIPTLLIDYPENASVDLGISPDYVSTSNDPQDLARILIRAYQDQERDWIRLGEWKLSKLPSMNAQHSVEQLLKVIQEKLKQNRTQD